MQTRRLSRGSLRLSARLLAVTALIGLAAFLLALQGASLGPDSVAASNPEAEMRVSVIDGSGGFCNGSTCYAGVNRSFTLMVEAVTVPGDGYVVMQTMVDFGTFLPAASEDGAGPGTCSDGINNGTDFFRDRFDTECATTPFTYQPQAIADEITWPDAASSGVFRREYGTGMLHHGGITGLVPPLAVSSHVGSLVEFDLTCPSTAVTIPIAILPYGAPATLNTGALFAEADGIDQHIPKVNTITLNCVTKQWIGDRDGDGCRDARENNANPALGGLRDYLDPWDFYDVARAGGIPLPDGQVDLPNDIMGVINHYSPTGAPPYDVHYDRGEVDQGGDQWPTAPDGFIDQTDIDNVFAQQGHKCF